MLIYELYVDKFAGNFQGLTTKLPYLKDLGVGCVWILPHYPSPMVDDGYDVADYFNVRPELGTLDDFREFASSAHALGIKVCLDLVLNHTSIEHPWFRAHPDYYLHSPTGTEFPRAINAFAHLKPSNWIRDQAGDGFYFATFYPQQADLNWDNPAVFDEMMRVIEFWTEMGADGFRLDAAPFLIKREGTDCTNLPETHAILKKIRAHIDARKLEVFLLAEANGTLDQMKSYFGDGDECHFAFHFHAMTALFLALARNDTSVIQAMITQSGDIPHNCQWVHFLRNHDELTLEHVSADERTELIKQYGPGSATGIAKRLTDLFDGDQAKILGAFRLLMNLPGSHVLYYGDELGQRNLHITPPPLDTRHLVRGPFDWSEAERQSTDPESLLNKIKNLIAGSLYFIR